MVGLAAVVLLSSAMRSAGASSSTLRTSLWLWRLTRTASADVTQPEQARQSVREIWAGSEAEGGCWPSRMTSFSGEEEEAEGAGGRVSTGLMQATPGVMKSFRSSAERMADIVGGGFSGEGRCIS